MTNEGTAAPGETSSGSWGREAVAELRGAVYRAEGEAVLPALRGRPLEPILQKAGDGLLVAVAQGIAGAPEAATRCAELLRERWWEGDEDLAVQLEAALGSGPAPMLRALPVDLEELSMMLEGDPLYGGGRIDLRTGETWPSGTEDVWSEEFGEEDREDDSDPDDLDDAEDRWLYVECLGSRDGYRDMEDFIETIPRADRRDMLEVAITGRGAFRRFKDVIDRWPDEIERWHVFSDERRMGRARERLAAHGYRPAPKAR